MSLNDQDDGKNLSTAMCIIIVACWVQHEDCFQAHYLLFLIFVALYHSASRGKTCSIAELARQFGQSIDS